MAYDTYKGRKVIFTDETEITAKNIVDVLKEAFTVHKENAAQIKFLEDYEKGITPISNRVKEVRPEINFKINENHAHEITSFKTGYVFSSPIAYVQRSEKDARSDNGATAEAEHTGIGILNEMMLEESKASKDQQLAQNFTVCGIGYKMAFPKPSDRRDGLSVFDVVVLDPKTTFIVYSNDIYRRPLMAVSYSVSQKLSLKSYKIGAYTNEHYFELTAGDGFTEIKLVGEPKENNIGRIPIIEYSNDFARMGCFERCLDLLDAINLTTSDRLNGLAQMVQSFVWFSDCDISPKEFKELRDAGGLSTTSPQGKQSNVKYLTNNIDQSQIQVFADYLYEQVLSISATPSRAQSSGGNTGQAIVLGGGGWALCESAAKTTEQLFKQSEREFLKVVLEIINTYLDDIDLKLSDIEIKFSRNKTDNLVSKTQALLNLIGAGVHPLHAFETVGLFSDPQNVYNDSADTISSENGSSVEDKSEKT